VCEAVALVVERVEPGDHFLFLGDLSNPYSSGVHRAVELSVRVAAELNCREVMNTWLTGNHDVVEDASGSHTLLALKALDTSWLPAGGFTRVADEPRALPFEDWLLLTLPFTAPTRAYDPVEQVERYAEQYAATEVPVVIAGHLNIEGIAAGSETSDMARGRDVMFPLERVLQLFPRAILLNGHYHEQQVFRGIRIPGSLLRLTHSEEEHEKGFLILELGP
jgi:hypothetical protein